MWGGSRRAATATDGRADGLCGRAGTCRTSPRRPRCSAAASRRSTRPSTEVRSSSRQFSIAGLIALGPGPRRHPRPQHPVRRLRPRGAEDCADQRRRLQPLPVQRDHCAHPAAFHPRGRRGGRHWRRHPPPCRRQEPRPRRHPLGPEGLRRVPRAVEGGQWPGLGRVPPAHGRQGAWRSTTRP